MSVDSTSGSAPCSYTSDGNWDVFKPTNPGTKTNTAANKCTHLQMYAKNSSKINQCRAIGSIGSCPREKCGWREVRSIPVRNNWHPATDKLVGSHVYGEAYSTTEPWSVKFDNVQFDQFMFTTGDFTKWLVCTKTAIIGWYSNGQRPVLASSSNSNPYLARWYRRTPNNPEDPWVSIGDYSSDVIYGANNNGGNGGLRSRGGAKVFIRDSTGNTDSGCYNPNTVK